MLWARLGENSFTVAILLGEKGRLFPQMMYNIGEVKKGLVNKRRRTVRGNNLKANTAVTRQ